MFSVTWDCNNNIVNIFHTSMNTTSSPFDKHIEIEMKFVDIVNGPVG